MGDTTAKSLVNNDASEKQIHVKTPRRNRACEMEGGGGTIPPNLCHRNAPASRRPRRHHELQPIKTEGSLVTEMSTYAVYIALCTVTTSDLC